MKSKGILSFKNYMELQARFIATQSKKYNLNIVETACIYNEPMRQKLNNRVCSKVLVNRIGTCGMHKKDNLSSVYPIGKISIYLINSN